MRTAAHLAHEPLLLHLAPELSESLFELLRILDHDSHSRKRIPDGGFGRASRLAVVLQEVGDRKEALNG